MYSKNRIGPRTEPYGTLYNTADSVDLVEGKRTHCVRLLRYDANQARTDPRP